MANGGPNNEVRSNGVFNGDIAINEDIFTNGFLMNGYGH